MFLLRVLPPKKIIYTLLQLSLFRNGHFWAQIKNAPKWPKNTKTGAKNWPNHPSDLYSFIFWNKNSTF